MIMFMIIIIIIIIIIACVVNSFFFLKYLVLKSTVHNLPAPTVMKTARTSFGGSGDLVISRS